MLNVQTPDQVTQNEQTAKADERASFEIAAPDLLAGHVSNCWSIAKQSRLPITGRLLDCLRRKRGIYSPQKLEQIRQTGGSEIYMKLTGAKCRAAKAWFSDLLSPNGDKPWVLEATKIPDLPAEMKMEIVRVAMEAGINSGLDRQTVVAMMIENKDRLIEELNVEAQEKADKMADKIEDTLSEGGWQGELDKFLDDFVTFPYAVIKGLEFKTKKRIKWVDSGTGQQIPVASSVIQPSVRRVDPFMFYPSPAVSDEMEGHWCIEQHRYTRADLAGMRHSPGYRPQEIAKALQQYASGGLREWMFADGERERIEGKQHNFQTDEIDALEWSGSLQGQFLLDHGVDPASIDDPLEEYEVSIEMIGNFIIRSLVNPDPLGKSDYHFTSWDPVPGAFAGNALPELMADQSDMCNAAARSLSNNMGISSGPQVWVETDRVAEGANVTDIYPWKVWQSGTGPSGGPGVGFFQPQSNANELMAIYERFSRYADESVGLPAYSHGSDQGAGAAQTAKGLGMLMNAASKTVKQGVRSIDLHVIERIVEKAFVIEMLTGEDPSIKGDAVPKARGSQALIHREEVAVRAQSILAQTANPLDHAIIGVEGRHELLKEMIKSSDMPVDRIIPDLDEVKQRMQEQQQMEQQNAQLNQPA